MTPLDEHLPLLSEIDLAVAITACNDAGARNAAAALSKHIERLKVDARAKEVAVRVEAMIQERNRILTIIGDKASNMTDRAMVVGAPADRMLAVVASLQELAIEISGT